MNSGEFELLHNSEISVKELCHGARVVGHARLPFFYS